MAQYPRTVYAIFPFNTDGSFAGVYVGSTYRLKERLQNHMNDYHSCHMAEFHDLMRRNGFNLQELDVIRNLKENHLEYDWIDFFQKRTDLKVFNYRKAVCADWHRLKVSS